MTTRNDDKNQTQTNHGLLSKRVALNKSIGKRKIKIKNENFTFHVYNFVLEVQVLYEFKYLHFPIHKSV